MIISTKLAKIKKDIKLSRFIENTFIYIRDHAKILAGVPRAT